MSSYLCTRYQNRHRRFSLAADICRLHVYPELIRCRFSSCPCLGERKGRKEKSEMGSLAVSCLLMPTDLWVEIKLILQFEQTECSNYRCRNSESVIDTA